jgi:hypothetical protein
MKCRQTRLCNFRMGKSFRLNAPFADGTHSQGVDKIAHTLAGVCAQLAVLSVMILMILVNELQVGVRCHHNHDGA